MKDAVRHLQEGLRALAVPGGWSRVIATEKETEFAVSLPGGPLEVSASSGFASVAYGPNLWEDLNLRTDRDAERVLAACDAILGVGFSETRAGSWLWRSVVSRLQLTTRGFDEVIEDRTTYILDMGRNRQRTPSEAR